MQISTKIITFALYFIKENMQRIFKTLLLLTLLLSSSFLAAEVKQPISVRFDVRADWENHFRQDPDSMFYESGFAGKYLNFMLDGNISEHFSYHLRYRFNKINTGSDFFNATDWAYLDYNINKNWRVSAGKQVVYIGGFEYDAAPIDVYYWSTFWNNVNCYEFGVSGQYTTNDGRSTILAQISNSPFADRGYRLDGLYAYNLIWYGSYGCFKSIYSANMIEYAPGQYTNYIALGNQWTAGPVTIQLDYMNRYYLHQTGGFFNDFTLIGKVDCNIKNCVNLFVKGGFDYNDTGNADAFVPTGTKYGFVGVGCEYYPIKDKKNLRLHAFWHSNTDNNFKDQYLTIGLKWLLTAFERK